MRPVVGAGAGAGGGSNAPAAPRTKVAVSFGSPASESGVGRLDLNELLIRHPQAAFLMRISGAAMREAGIDDGDLALVDRAVDAAHGHVVIAVLGDEFVCRRLHRRADARGNDLRLQATDPATPDVVVSEGERFELWGVVTHVIKPVSAALP